MRNARDTFLHLIADNLPQYTVHNVRRDVARPQQSQLAANAINIEFYYDKLSVIESGLQAAIDVIYDDELVTINVVEGLSRILNYTEYTPLKSYAASITEPVHLGTNLRWSSKQIKFSKLVSDLYFRYNCRLYLMYNDPTMGPF